MCVFDGHYSTAAFPNGMFSIFLHQLTIFQPTKRVARSLCNSSASHLYWWCPVLSRKRCSLIVFAWNLDRRFPSDDVDTSRPSKRWVPYTVKNIRISTESGPGLRYSVDLPIHTYTEPVPIKYGKHATKYPWIYGYFLQWTPLLHLSKPSTDLLVQFRLMDRSYNLSHLTSSNLISTDLIILPLLGVRSIMMTMSVCLFVRPLAKLENHT